MMDAQIEKGERLDLPKGTVVNINKLVNLPGSVYNGEKQEKYNVVLRGWVARNQNGTLYLYVTNEGLTRRRARNTHAMGYWCSKEGNDIQLDPSLFPDVDWEDENPTEVQIKIM